MPGSIKETAIEGSSYKVTATFYDESGNAVAPDTMTWTLTDEDGSVVNAREDVAVTDNPLTSSMSILLQGDDLVVDGNDPVKRIVTFEGTYTSADFGAGLPLIDESVFTLIPITII